MRSRARILQAFASACLAGAVAPIVLVWLMSVGAPSAEALMPLTGFSVGAAALGLLACGLAYRASRSAMPVVLGFFLLVSGALAMAIFVEGLQQRAYSSDLALCGAAERQGRTIRRGEVGYRSRLDQDGDGLACEPVLGPECDRGRCVPFG